MAQTTDVEFFETKIRPVLVQRCYSCHNSKMAAPKGDLILDTKEGLLKGGMSGPVLVPGNPAESRLLKVLSYTDPLVQMPPSGKLADAVLEDFTQWIARGAADPRASAPALASASPQYKGMSLEEGRKWWAFQPVAAHAAPKVAPAQGRPANKIDNFILARLAEKNLQLSPQADKRTLVTRAYVGLLGFKPTFEEVQAFLNDRSPNAYENLIDRLLKSPHYGERWARHWMDVARYADDNPSSEATNPPYPFAWRYRDWIIESLNADMPYDRFVKLQLAADLMPDAKRDDMRALGYVGAAPIYHHDLRLSGDVIGTFLTDDWDERIDAVSRGVLGLSVACARCHDHKFDPVTTKDYYALMGVFASTVRVGASDVPGGTGGRAGIHVAAAQAVRPRVFDQPARERRHDLYQRRREGGEVESGNGRPESAGHHQSCQVSAAAFRAWINTGIRRAVRRHHRHHRLPRPPAARFQPPQRRLRNRHEAGCPVDRSLHERGVRGGAVRRRVRSHLHLDYLQAR